MVRSADPNAKRLQIIQAAAAVFAKSGYDAALMDDVAAAAGVSKGSLYDYFRNKEDLFYAVFEWFQRRLLDASVAEIAPGTDARAQVAAFAEAAVGALVAHVDLYPVTLEVWSAAAKPASRQRFATAMRDLYSNYRGAVAALIRVAQANGEIAAKANADVLAAVLIGAVDGVLLQYWLDPTFDARAWVREFLENLFDGIGVRKSGEMP